MGVFWRETNIGAVICLSIAFRVFLSFMPRLFCKHSDPGIRWVIFSQIVVFIWMHCHFLMSVYSFLNSQVPFWLSLQQPRLRLTLRLRFSLRFLFHLLEFLFLLYSSTRQPALLVLPLI